MKNNQFDNLADDPNSLISLVEDIIVIFSKAAKCQNICREYQKLLTDKSGIIQNLNYDNDLILNLGKKTLKQYNLYNIQFFDDMLVELKKHKVDKKTIDFWLWCKEASGVCAQDGEDNNEKL